MQKRNPWTNSDKILHGSIYPDIITYTNFGAHRLTGLLGGGGQIFPLYMDFHRLPNNTNTTMRVCKPMFDRFSRTPAWHTNW